MTLQFKILVGAAVLLAGALTVFGLLQSRKLLRFSYMASPLSEADYGAMAAKPGWRAYMVDVAPGIRLRGLLRAPARPDAPWVVFFNGNSANMLREGQQMLDALCAERGWGGVVWAYRGYDSSGGAPDPAAAEADAFKAWSALLAEQKLQPSAVHLVGFSMGTGIAAAVAAQAHQQPPASLTLLAPMTAIHLGERTQLRLHRYETSKWLGAIASPVLVIHGTQDATLGVEHGRAVAQALGSRAQLLELPGAGHYELTMLPAVQEAMRDFIQQHMAATSPQPAAP
jgi:uncharacterized protein